jgi:hypothetical protein
MPVRMMTTRVLLGTLAAAASHSAVSDRRSTSRLANFSACHFRCSLGCDGRGPGPTWHAGQDFKIFHLGGRHHAHGISTIRDLASTFRHQSSPASPHSTLFPNRSHRS